MKKHLSRILALTVLVCVALIAWRNAASSLAASLQAGRPIAGILSARFKGQGRVIPPALYLILYGPASGTLDLIFLPASLSLPQSRTSQNPDNPKTLADIYGQAYLPDGNMQRALDSMREAALQIADSSPCLESSKMPWLELELSEDAQPASPNDMKHRIWAWANHTFFWPRSAIILWNWPKYRSGAISAYDAFLGAWALARLDPEKIVPARLSDKNLIQPLLGRACNRALGLQEPDLPPTAEVLNASDEDGVAWQATKILRSHGIDVRYFGNAEMKEDRLQIIERLGFSNPGRAVAQALGCPPHTAITQMEAKPKAAVTVVVGQDFARCSALAPPGSQDQ